MSDSPRYATMRDYLRVVRQHRLLVALTTLLFGAAALTYSLTQTPSYLAEASMSFNDPSQDFLYTSAPVGLLVSPEQRAAIAAKSVTQARVAAVAQSLLHTKIPVATLQHSVGAQAESQTNLVVIQAHWRDGPFAARLANQFAQAAVQVATDDARNRFTQAAVQARRAMRSLPDTPVNAGARQTRAEEVSRFRDLAQITRPAQIAQAASTPTSPDSPRPVRNTVLGLLLGLAIGLLGAFMRDSLDRRFKSSSEIKEELGLPILAHVPEDLMGRSVGAQNGRPALTDADLEVFRILRANIDFLDVDHRPKTMVVTSALPEEGKSTVAAALALAHARAGRRTLLIEGDLRRPTLAKRLGLELGPGLSDVLLGTVSLRDACQRVSVGSSAPTEPSVNGEGGSRGPTPAPDVAEVDDAALEFFCLTAGAPSPRPAELLGSDTFRRLLTETAAAYEVVILDSSPLLSVVDTLELVPLVDCVLICVRSSRTTREQGRAAKAAIERFPTRPTGVVVTGTLAGDELAYGYYAYAYGSSD